MESNAYNPNMNNDMNINNNIMNKNPAQQEHHQDPFAGLNDLEMTSNMPEPTMTMTAGYTATPNPANNAHNNVNTHNNNSSSSFGRGWNILKSCLLRCLLGFHVNCILNTFQFLKKSRHPIPAFFHFAFKLLAFVVYITGGFFEKRDFVFIAVVCIMMNAFDFWVVKNVTGRLLVGLRWWNKVNPDGSTEWIYESATQQMDQDPGHKHDSKLFWTVLYVTPMIWMVLLIVGLLKLNISWALIVVCALVLNGANVYGYWNCSKDQKQKVKEMMANASFGAAQSMFFGGFGSSNASNGNNQQVIV